MSPHSRVRLFARGSFPRVSGDEPELDTVSDFDTVFSPRERG